MMETPPCHSRNVFSLYCANRRKLANVGGTHLPQEHGFCVQNQTQKHGLENLKMVWQCFMMSFNHH